MPETLWETIHGVDEEKRLRRRELFGETRTGYVENSSPMENYEELGLICGYEHCIELQPLTETKLSCPVFGHNCPGGLSQVRVCNGKPNLYLINGGKMTESKIVDLYSGEAIDVWKDEEMVFVNVHPNSMSFFIPLEFWEEFKKDLKAISELET